jgi:quercetin dioxygenase-like cupin family protein
MGGAFLGDTEMRKAKTLWRSAIAMILAGGGTYALTAPALASPGSGVTPTTYVTADLTESVDFNHNRVKFQTKEPTTVRVQKLEFAAGGHTGFHHHPGVVIVSVQSGSLTLVDGSCATEVHEAGSVFVEGEDHVHEAVSPGGATVYVTYVVPRDYTPANEKFRVEEQVPFCATSLNILSKKP